MAKKIAVKSSPKTKSMPTQSGKIMNSKFRDGSENTLQNGLSDALGLNTLVGPGLGTQLSEADTLFKNNRWYLISNMRSLLSQIYVEHGIIQNVIDVPVDDGLRGGILIQSKQLSEEQINDLLVSVERDNDISKVGQGMKWNRLYGGAGVLAITGQNPETPLDIKSISLDSPLEFRPVDMWELFWDKQNVEGYNPELQEHEFEYYSYYGKKVHKSRVLRMEGLVAPSFIRPRLRGWGFSVIEAMVRSINQYLKSNNLSFEVLDEFKLDVYKLKDLKNTLLQPGGDAKVKQRVGLANGQKNYQKAVVLDAEDDFDHKQLSFAGLSDAMKEIRNQVAADLRMPQTKIFGQSSAGFNSGEDDIEVYNSMVEGTVRNNCKPIILKIIEIKCQKLFGMIPSDLKIEFKPLRVLSAEQEETVKTNKFNRVLAARTAGEIDSLEFRECCNRDNLLPIQLDVKNINTEIDTTDTEEEVPEDKESLQNSLEFDKKAFEVDGGIGQFDPKRAQLYQDDYRFEDKSLYKKAKEASLKLFGREYWQFILWKYKELGGKVI